MDATIFYQDMGLRSLQDWQPIVGVMYSINQPTSMYVIQVFFIESVCKFRRRRNIFDMSTLLIIF